MKLTKKTKKTYCTVVRKTVFNHAHYRVQKNVWNLFQYEKPLKLKNGNLEIPNKCVFFCMRVYTHVCINMKNEKERN